MQYELVGTAQLELQRMTAWLWYSDSTSNFIVGDGGGSAFAIPVADPARPSQLRPDRPLTPVDGYSAVANYPCNRSIPDSLDAEFIREDWHGFYFLEKSAYDHTIFNGTRPKVGEHLPALPAGWYCGHYVLHRASGLLLGIHPDGESMQLLKQTPDGFTVLDHVRTLGRSPSAFAGHPTDALIAYTDKAGNFIAREFSDTGFKKKKRKMAEKQPLATTLKFIDSGATLLVGGKGYAAAYSCEDHQCTKVHEISSAVRDFSWAEDRRTLLINQGLHGVGIYCYDEHGFTKLGLIRPETPVQCCAASTSLNFLAVTSQRTSDVCVYAEQAAEVER